MRTPEPEWKYMRPPPPGLWGRLSDDARQCLVEQHEKLRSWAKTKQAERARLDAEIAERMRQANWVDPAKADMRTRIYKWLAADGTRYPRTPEGIERHKALVAEYVSRWGFDGISSFMTGCQLVYADIEKTAQRQAEYDAASLRWAREQQEREANAARRAAAIEEERRRNKKEKRKSARVEAGHDIERHEASIAQYLLRVDQHKADIRRNFKHLESMLLYDATGQVVASPETLQRIEGARSGSSRLRDTVALTDEYLETLPGRWRPIMKRNRDNYAGGVRRGRELVAQFEQLISEREAQIAALREFLDADATPPPPAPRSSEQIRTAAPAPDPDPASVKRESAAARSDIEGLLGLDVTSYTWERRGNLHYPADWRHQEINLWVRRNGTGLLRVPAVPGVDLTGMVVDLGDTEVRLSMRRATLAVAELTKDQVAMLNG